jgi:Trypsin-like peptidase domain
MARLSAARGRCHPYRLKLELDFTLRGVHNTRKTNNHDPGNMTPETRTRLQNFDVDELKQELLARGSSTHARVAAALALDQKDLAGNAALAEFSSKDIAFAMREGQKAIYGVDDRKDLFEITDQSTLRNAQAVVSLFRASSVHNNGDGTSTLRVGKFGQINSLCPEESFFDQPVGAFCTGFLVAPDIIATAGHCVNESNATTIRFVFGFRMVDAVAAQVVIDNRDIYSGAAVVGRKLTDKGTDWCLVRLDRAVSDRQVLALRRAGKIPDGQNVYVIGHPSGLPAKFADGAQVRTNTQPAFFTANLDTYGGNSGSPVFNSTTHEVEGVLVRGAPDFVPLGMCMISAVCPNNGCEGEDCTRVSEFLDRLGSHP